MTTETGTHDTQWTCGCGKQVRLILEATYGQVGDGRAARMTLRPTHCEMDKQEKILPGRVLDFSEQRGSEWVTIKRWS